MKASKIVFCPTATLVSCGVERCYVNSAYQRAIERAGGILVTVSSRDLNSWKVLLTSTSAHCGVLLQGGCDINPNLYAGDREVGTDYDHGRDQLEIDLVRYLVDDRPIPLLGICRGMQVMNVAAGGSLKNLDSQGPTNHFRRDLSRDQKTHELHEVYPRSSALKGIDMVNSIHHQAISKVARRYEVVATAEDGTVEAIRHHRKDFFCLGVQWHPEELPDHHGIFDAFVGSIK